MIVTQQHQSIMRHIWTTQLDDASQGGQFLSADGRDRVRQALETNDFKRTSDTVFLELNRKFSEVHGHGWRAAPVPALWTTTPISELESFRDLIAKRGLKPLTPKARKTIATRFAAGHLFAYEIPKKPVNRTVALMNGSSMLLSDLGVRFLCDAGDQLTALVPSLSLLSALHLALFDKDALLPLAVAGAIPRLALHDLHIKGQRAVGLSFADAEDDGGDMEPACFAWHDISHGIAGMTFGDKRIYRIARHFAYAMERCERVAKAKHPDFCVPVPGKSDWSLQRRNLHDLFVTRHSFKTVTPLHDQPLRTILGAFLRGGEFDRQTKHGATYWQLFWEALTPRLRQDTELKSDSVALALLKIAEILRSKPEEIEDANTLNKWWANRIAPELGVT